LRTTSFDEHSSWRLIYFETLLSVPAGFRQSITDSAWPSLRISSNEHRCLVVRLVCRGCHPSVLGDPISLIHSLSHRTMFSRVPRLGGATIGCHVWSQCRRPAAIKRCSVRRPETASVLEYVQLQVASMVSPDTASLVICTGNRRQMFCFSRLCLLPALRAGDPLYSGWGPRARPDAR
jgi:hypothetical protein